MKPNVAFGRLVFLLLVTQIIWCHVTGWLRNNIGKRVLHIAVYTLNNGLLWRLLSLFQNRKNKMQVNESIPYEILTKYVQRFRDTGKSIYRRM
jgi:hypothetical protein